MTPDIALVIPAVAGALTLLGAIVISIVKTYRWFLGEIRTAINEALMHHEKREGDWQRGVERRLGDIEAKVDRLVRRDIANH